MRIPYLKNLRIGKFSFCQCVTFTSDHKKVKRIAKEDLIILVWSDCGDICGYRERNSLAAISKNHKQPAEKQTSSLACPTGNESRDSKMQIDVFYCLRFQQMVIENY